MSSSASDTSRGPPGRDQKPEWAGGLRVNAASTLFRWPLNRSVPVEFRIESGVTIARDAEPESLQ